MAYVKFTTKQCFIKSSKNELYEQVQTHFFVSLLLEVLQNNN